MSADDLNAWLAERNLRGAWAGTQQENADEVQPCLWRWAEIYPALLKAGELVPMSMTEMRTISPRLTGPAARLKSVSLGAQILMPGERTRAHRNLKNETRFVVKASPGATFIVDGEPFPVEEGDLVITPTWAWHDHYNGGSAPLVWMDGLDMGLVSLGTEINIRYKQGQQEIDKPEGASAAQQGLARPAWISHDHLPPYLYPWKQTYATLQALKASEIDADPCDGIHLTYTNPLTGGPTVPTFACEVQLLNPHMTTRAHRHNSTTVYHAFRGEGVTVVGDERLQWAQGDIFVLPPWAWHHHENWSSQDAILYSVTDRPALTALGLYEEETSP